MSRLLAPRQTNIEVTPYRVLEPLLRVTDFWTITQIEGYKLDNALLSALTERWKSKTHMFHLSWGECTITLEDVSMILGLQVDGKVVTSHSANFEVDGRILEATDYMEYLLGVRPVGKELDGAALSMAFLHRNFTVLLDGIDGDAVDWWFDGSEQDFLSVHICYLSLLLDLNTTGKYNWGAAVLAVLYRYLCKGTPPDFAQIGG